MNRGPGGTSSTGARSVFNLAFARPKLTSLVFAWCAIERNGCWNLSRMVRHQLFASKEPENGPNRESVTPTLYSARDRELIGILTGAAMDCGPPPGRTSPAPRWLVITVKQAEEGVVSMGLPLKKIHRNIIF